MACKSSLSVMQEPIPDFKSYTLVNQSYYSMNYYLHTSPGFQLKNRDVTSVAFHICCILFAYSSPNCVCLLTVSQNSSLLIFSVTEYSYPFVTSFTNSRKIEMFVQWSFISVVYYSLQLLQISFFRLKIHYYTMGMS